MSYAFFRSSVAVLGGVAKISFPITASISALSFLQTLATYGPHGRFAELVCSQTIVTGFSLVMAVRFSPKRIKPYLSDVEEAYASGAYDMPLLPILPRLNIEFLTFEIPVLGFIAIAAAIPLGAVFFAMQVGRLG